MFFRTIEYQLNIESLKWLPSGHQGNKNIS